MILKYSWQARRGVKLRNILQNWLHVCPEHVGIVKAVTMWDVYRDGLKFKTEALAFEAVNYDRHRWKRQ